MSRKLSVAPDLPIPSQVRCIVHAPRGGAWNMAVDEALMAAARRGVVTLRFYGWTPPCLSFGRNQMAVGKYDRAGAKDRSIDVVRRPTGGRAVFHDSEITYSVTAPASLWGGLRASYRRLNRALARGLRRLGAPVDAQPMPVPSLNDIAGDVGVRARRQPGVRAARTPAPSARACFRDTLPGEVTCGGRKLVGSAQWRRRGALLQHGSILLANDQQVVDELRRGGPPGYSDTSATSLAELLTPLPECETITRELAGGFERELELSLVFEDMTPAERRLAGKLEALYSDDGWTWRR